MIHRINEAPKILEVKDLSVHYFTDRGAVIAANKVNFYLRQGEIMGLVGESGCGKTTVAMAILQMVQSPGKITNGEIWVDGEELNRLSERQLRQLRWRKLALVPQGAMNSLNPVLKIKEQLGDSIQAHERGVGGAALKRRILDLLDDVGLPARIYDMYPHELSGGMKQRVCIVMAIALNPPLIIADEPTSVLDVVVQRVVAQTLLDVKKRLGVSMLMIGHDMGLQAQMVDRVAVMYAGNLVEVGPVEAIFEQPLHPYTQLLIESIPSIDERKPLKVTEGLTHDLRNPPPGCIFQFRCPYVQDVCREARPPLEEVAPDHFVACIRVQELEAGVVMATPILQIKNATKTFGGGFLDSTPPLVALDHFNLDIYESPARITTIAGESGSGKTTLASAILGFLPLTEGQVLYKGQDIAAMDRRGRLAYRKEVQAIFQDPYEVYNPFFRVQHIFDMAMRHFPMARTKKEARGLIEDALKLVGMRGDEILEKHPHQLSGGQRQRVMVARAYMLRPRLIVADEPVSAVDASLRAMILDIMLRLRDEHGISFLYITHDLSTAYQIGDEMVILFQGIVAERGSTVDIIENPKHPYVQELIASIPAPNPKRKWVMDITLPPEDATRLQRSNGCRFYARCPARMERCKTQQPPLYSIGGNGHEASCFLYESGAGAGAEG